MFDTKKESKFLSDFKKLKEKLENLYWKDNPKWYLKFKKEEDEEFKSLKEYQGLYFVSNYGQVVSFHRKSPTLLSYKKSKGFFTVSLALDGPQRLHYVHELVFNHFVGRQGKGRVIHKNGDITDNYYKNLRLARQVKKPEKKPRSGLAPRKPDPVLQFDEDGKFIAEYPSVKDASGAVQASASGIRYCIKGKGRSSGGYQWRAKNDPFFSVGIRDIHPMPPRKSPRSRKILQFKRNGTFVREYSSISEASREIKIDVASIVGCAAGKNKTAGGYQWYYRDHPVFNFGIINVPPIPKMKSPHRRAVLQFDLDGNFIKEYPFIGRAARAVGITGLNSCLKGKAASAGGYQWRYKDDPLFKDGIVKLPPVVHRDLHKAKPVVQYSIEGKFLQEYPSLFEAMRISGVSNNAIVRCLQGKMPLAGGYQWRLKSQVLEEKKGKRKTKKIRNIEPLKEVPPKYPVRPVCQFTLEGKFIKEYPSLREAERKTGIPSIHGAVREEYKTAGGFQWRYKDDPMFKKGITDIPAVSSKRRFSSRKETGDRIPYDYSTPVLQFNKEGKFLREFSSLMEAAKISRIDRQHIVQASRGKEKCAGGFQWRYKNDPVFKKGICNLEPVKMDYFTVPVLQFDLKGNYIAEYPSYAEASRVVGVKATSISSCARGIYHTAAGYQWRLKNDPVFENGVVNIPPIKKVTGTIRNGILQFDRQGKFIRQFSSMMAAARAVNRSVRTIRAAVFKQCKSTAGFQWRSINDPLFENGIKDIEPLDK